MHPLPFLEVTHLPSSSSFYSAVTQPLGLRYLYTASGFVSPSDGDDQHPLQQHPPSGGHQREVTFGAPPQPAVPAGPLPVFQVRQVTPTPERPLKLSHLVLTAPSPQAVRDFHALALRANPPLADPALQHLLAPSVASSAADANRGGPGCSDLSAFGTCSETHATIIDLDGNKMEVVYVPPPNYPSQYTGSTFRRTQSTEDEVSRIMDWNYDVASSGPATAAPAIPRHNYGSSAGPARPLYPGRHEHNEPPPYVLRRSVTTSTITEQPLHSSSPPRETSISGGVTATTAGMVGGLLGAAVGAAVTYGMMKSDRSQAPQQEFEAPEFQRRSTFPDPYPDNQRRRYVELERTVEKIRYPDQYPDVGEVHAPPTYLARYSQIGGGRSKAVEDFADDTRSRHSTRYRGEPTSSSVRTRSEAPVYRAPLAIAEAEHRSYTSSRHTDGQLQQPQPPPPPPPPQSITRRSTYDTSERDSYVSARSHRSSSTIKPPPGVSAPSVPYPPIAEASRASRAGSRTSTVTVRERGMSAGPARRSLSRADSHLSSRHVPLPASKVGSHVSARQVPLPASKVGSHVSARQVPLPASKVGSYVSARHMPLPPSIAGSHISARQVPLPHSRVGGSHAGWEVDDDADSIAPSDSISCVGSHRSGRSHH